MIDRNFTQRTRLRMIGAVILFVGLVVGLTACVAFWQGPEAVLRFTLETVEAPLIATFDISESHGRGQEIATFKLEFGDGEYIEGTDIDPPIPITHTYAKAGIFHAVLTITDAAGATGRTERRIDILVRAYFSSRLWIERVETPDGVVERVGGVPGLYNLFPSLVLNTRDKIAFAAGAATPPYLFDIWRMSIEGGSLEQLTDTGDAEIQPTWSRDGGKIAYARHKDGLLWQIWRMTATGTGHIELINQTPSHVWAPAFSPVNDDLVFVQHVDADESKLMIRLGTATPAVLYSVTNVRVGDPSPPPFVMPAPAGAGISQPRWSPCGTRIVFARERGPGDPIIDIHVLTVPATGTATSKTLEEYVIGDVDPITTPADEFSPHWLEDDNIVFIREVAGEFLLFHIDLATGVLTQLTDHGVAISPAQR